MFIKHINIKILQGHRTIFLNYLNTSAHVFLEWQLMQTFILNLYLKYGNGFEDQTTNFSFKLVHSQRHVYNRLGIIFKLIDLNKYNESFSFSLLFITNRIHMETYSISNSLYIDDSVGRRKARWEYKTLTWQIFLSIKDNKSQNVRRVWKPKV